MTQTQQRVLRALDSEHVLEVGDGMFVEKRTIYGVHGEPDDVAVSFEWSDDKGYIWEADFTERSLAKAKIEANKIQMPDSQGEEVIITAFQLEPAHI